MSTCLYPIRDDRPTGQRTACGYIHADRTEDACPHDSRSGTTDCRWRCDECGADCGANTYAEEVGRG